MNSPAEMDLDDIEFDLPDDDDQSLGEVKFNGDTGTLAHEARRVLIRLLLGPSLDGRRHPKLWEAFLRHRAAIESRLNDMYLQAIPDLQARVAFVRQVTSDEVDVPILLRRQSLTFLESALLLFLRQKLTQSDAQDERAVVDRLEMTEYLRAYERSDNVDMSRFGRQMDGAIEKSKKLGILNRLAGSEDRYEISATLRLLFPVEEIQALTQAYKQHLPPEVDGQPEDSH